MPHENSPIVGDWYRNLQDELAFEIVAIDEDMGTVGIQYYEGEVEELDLDTWYDLELESIPPPEDWSGPFDDLERDDLGYNDGNLRPENWSGPLSDLEPED